ncbi:hypothetical protein OH76DRAFT_1218388 [Lentinus brumalis]|uniref:F-box domain-containing protein n=1 Tax=Lentinus brumalis TaxID=2498619 RepID=A0A371DLK1_9APHY|nr:hypothetical protein OH76DRAFT_1218388 [Polyporus brumalis]
MDTLSFERLPADVHEDICHWLVHGDSDSPDAKSSRKHSNDRYSGLRAVAALARTSRTLHESAADILWEWIPNLALLFYTLPRECYTTEQTEDRTIAFEIIRQLQDADLVRFRLYAARVNKVGVWDYTEDFSFLPRKVQAYASTHNSLLELCRVATVNGWRLLPNLTTLACTEETLPVSVSSHLPHLFGPSLREFKFEQHNLDKGPALDGTFPTAHVEGEENIVTMLVALRPHAAQLERLNIRVDDSSPPMVEAFWDVVLSCRNLVALDSGYFPLTPAALHHLAHLPLLEQLHFASLNGAFTKKWILEFESLLPSETFPRLHTSYMILVNLDLATAIVNHITSPSLRGLEIEIHRKRVPSVTIHRFFHSFCRLPDISALQWFHLRCTVFCHDSPGTSPAPITDKMLRPFLASSRIDFFELFVECPFDLDDAFIADMVRAWPNINNLRLGGSYPRGVGYVPEVTWNGIIKMARGWPGLKELSVEFDTDLSRASATRLEEVLESNRMNRFKSRRTLDFMHVGLSKVENDMAVATLLSELFTPITEIHSDWYDLAMQEEAEEQRRMEKEGDAFQPDPQLAERVALYATYHDRWCSMENPMRHIDLIRRQEGVMVEHGALDSESDDESMSSLD